MEEKYLNLIKTAIKQKQFSYSPYSNFKVGCALLTKNGNVYVGSNVENASYSPSLCAERVAISSAVCHGEKDLEAIAICGDSDYCYPCGVCRQTMIEFNPNIKIFIVKNETDFIVTIAKELLPHYFGDEVKKNESCD